MTGFYAGGLTRGEAWRREWSERAGLGFSLVGHLGYEMRYTLLLKKQRKSNVGQ